MMCYASGMSDEEEDTDPDKTNGSKVLREIRTAIVAIRQAIVDLRDMCEQRVFNASPPILGQAPYNADLTPAGGIHFTAGQLRHLQEQMATFEREKAMDQARAAGFKQALTDEELRSAKFRGRITFFIAIAVPVAGLLGYLATHVLHW